LVSPGTVASVPASDGGGSYFAAAAFVFSTTDTAPEGPATEEPSRFAAVADPSGSVDRDATWNAGSDGFDSVPGPPRPGPGADPIPFADSTGSSCAMALGVVIFPRIGATILSSSTDPEGGRKLLAFDPSSSFLRISTGCSKPSVWTPNLG